MNPDPQARAKLLVWWIVWGAMLPWILILQLLFKPAPVDPAIRAADLLVQLVGLVPLFLSIIIRWLVLPRSTSLAAAFPLFVAGLVLAEACGLLGIFLGGPYRDALFLLGVLGVTQYVPVFARRLGEPKGSGFIPNN